MSTDTLLNWASNPTTRKMISAVGLPTPQPLRRADGPWEDHPLDGLSLAVHETDGTAAAQLVEGMGATAECSRGE